MWPKLVAYPLWFRTTWITGLLMLAGCEGRVNSDARPQVAPAPASSANGTSGQIAGDPVVPAESAQADPPSPVVTVRVVDGAGFREVIQKHRGKVVLVDFWADW